jgi:TP901-1 family phage major tail protein|uniref:Major tail protein n=1 Tax=Siphoviridae sp. ctnNB1 TaxID=2825660 RepID=A0A8S5UVE5_9CAUD|nr:MAG TPA: major tail protein [Siphoviridae sp. ctnNB1]
MAFDNNNYCDFTSSVAKAVAGKDILLCVFNTTGDELLAISGQQGLTINRSADTIEITSKDTEGGWKSYLAGMKEWSIDNDGLYVPNDQSHSILSTAFENGDPVCIKVVNGKTKVGMFGGLAVITDYPIEAPYDDSMTYSITLSGMGALIDLLVNPVEPDTMPEGTAALESLTVVSVAGASSGNTAVYVNPGKGSGNSYKYVTGEAPLTYPTYGTTASGTEWNGTDEITATTGNEIMVIECDSNGNAVKAGTAIVTAMA